MPVSYDSLTFKACQWCIFSRDVVLTNNVRCLDYDKSYASEILVVCILNLEGLYIFHPQKWIHNEK